MPGAATIGSTAFRRGFCTHALHLRGKTLRELAELLGYEHQRLAAGANVLFLQSAPGPHDFQLSGYTHFSDGAVQGHLRHPAGRAPFQMEALLKTEHGWSDAQILDYKKRMIGSKITIVGPQRLAKLEPFTGYSAGEVFPPGKGVFQVRLIRELRFCVKAHILPGQKWEGDYK